MASPAIVTEASGTDTDASNGVTATFSGTAVAGELLIVVFQHSSAQSDGNWTTPTDYAELIDSGEQAIFWLDAAGGETTAVSTGTASGRAGWFAYRISAAADPAVTAPEIGTQSISSSTTPDPPAASITGGSKDYLFIALDCNTDGRRSVSSGPSGYSTVLTYSTGGGAAGGTGGSATLQSTTGTENPGTFAISASSEWFCNTITVHPVPPPASPIIEFMVP